MPIKSIVGEMTSDMTKEAFASELSSHTQLTAEQLQTLFPKPADRAELAELLKLVQASADENTQKAKLEANIGKVAGAVIKIVKNFVPGL